MYDLGDHPDFNFRPGTIVIRIGGSCSNSSTPDKAPSKAEEDDEDEFHSADDGELKSEESMDVTEGGDKNKAKKDDSWCHTGQVLENGLDGTLLLKWADGSEGKCLPTDLYRVRILITCYI